MRPGGFCMQIEEKIIQFLFVESILIYVHNLQYHSDSPPPTSNGRKAKEIPSCLCNDRGLGVADRVFLTK
jgi:hypothetical protein